MKFFRVCVYEGSKRVDSFKIVSANNITALMKAQHHFAFRNGIDDKDIYRGVSFSGLNTRERIIFVREGSRNRKYTIQISY